MEGTGIKTKSLYTNDVSLTFFVKLMTENHLVSYESGNEFSFHSYNLWEAEQNISLRVGSSSAKGK